MLWLSVGPDLQDRAGLTRGVGGRARGGLRAGSFNGRSVTVSSYEHSGPASLVVRGGSTSLVFTIRRVFIGVAAMNEDKIKGQWKQLAGKAKAKWGKLTDDDLKVTEGNSEYLAGKVQERYGIARDEAERQVKDFSSRL